MMLSSVLFLATVFVSVPHTGQPDGGALLMQLSGSEVDEGSYKQTALLSFDEFDDKCKLRRAGTVKLNKKTKTATKPIVAGKPVIVNCYYTDQRTQYGRSVNEKIVFYPEDGVNYILALHVDGGKVDIQVFQQGDDGSRGAAIAVQRGYVDVKCN